MLFIFLGKRSTVSIRFSQGCNLEKINNHDMQTSITWGSFIWGKLPHRQPWWRIPNSEKETSFSSKRFGKRVMVSGQPTWGYIIYRIIKLLWWGMLTAKALSLTFFYEEKQQLTKTPQNSVYPTGFRLRNCFQILEGPDLKQTYKENSCWWNCPVFKTENQLNKTAHCQCTSTAEIILRNKYFP